MIDVSGLLEPVAVDQPCGPNMEYDGAFTELERIAQGKPEQQVGATIVPGEEPDWRQVEKGASALLASTKDLRIAMHLTRALLRSSGYLGFAQGLAVLRGFVDTYWEQVHPQLDPDDDLDPTARMNVLAELCDQATVIQWVRTAPLVNAKGVGRYALRDVAIATGEESAPANYEGTPPNASSIEAAFLAADAGELAATMQAAREAQQYATEIESIVTDRVGAGNAVNLQKLRGLLAQAVKTMEKHVALRGDEPEAQGAVAGAPGAAADAAAAGSAPKRLEGEITSREDVIRAIDKICAYYQRSEPSSPIPMLLGRCKRLVNKDFLDIIRDMAPDGLNQVAVLRGRTEEEDGSS